MTKKSDEELSGDEDTTILDNLTNIKNTIKDVDVVCFNAHGRSYYSRQSSISLKNLVSQYSPTNNNISFNLKKYHDLIPLLDDNVKYEYFMETVLGNILKKYNLSVIIFM
mgnify:CR=1 FL=1